VTARPEHSGVTRKGDASREAAERSLLLDTLGSLALLAFCAGSAFVALTAAADKIAAWWAIPGGAGMLLAAFLGLLWTRNAR
jgi:hypothetical protein